jgi:protein ImuB
MFICVHGKRAAETAAEFAPAWEETDAETAVFDASPLGKLYGGAQGVARAVAARAGNAGGVALAPDVDAAILLARNTTGVIVARDAAKSLAPLPVESIALPEMLTVLEMWGIRTLEDLARLPEPGLAARFGEEGLRLLRLAQGRLGRPLRVHRAESVYEDHADLEHPVAEVERLLFVLNGLLTGLCARMKADGAAAGEVGLHFLLAEAPEHQRNLRLPVPVADARLLIKIVHADLEAYPPQAAVRRVEVKLASVPPRRAQHGLFEPPVPEPARLELTLGRIRGWVGEENVGLAQLLDTHRPEPFTLAPHQSPHAAAQQEAVRTPRLALRYFRPALRARVAFENGRPKRIDAPDLRGRVLAAAGPWRTSGNWWTARESWDREEWDLSLDNGAICRIYRTPSGDWFVEGAYD